MWFVVPDTLTRTSPWRLTLVFTAIFLLINAGMLLVVYWATLGAREQQLRDSVLDAARTYRELGEHHSLDATAFRDLIAEQTRRAATTILVLRDARGVAGNLSSMPAAVPGFPATGRFSVAVSGLQRENRLSSVLGTRVVLTRGGELVVGLIDDGQPELRRDFLVASAGSLVGALLMTLCVGFLFSRRAVDRLRRLGRQIALVKSGELQARLPQTGSGDEYDVIAGQVNDMLDEIDELLQSVVSVTDNIAHDLRTPLSRIRLRLEQLGASLDSPQQQVLQDAVADLDQVLQTFEAMLELTRLERGATSLDDESSELAAVARDAVDLLLPLAEERDQTLVLEVAGAGAVRGDRSLLFRAIYNLIHNAVLHGGAGCRIQVRVEHDRLIVEDNGPGIPEGMRGRVFQRLFRLDGSRQTPGTGLGLAIVRAVAERHHAEVLLEDALPGLRASIRFN